MKLLFNKRNSQVFWTIPKNIWGVNPAGISTGRRTNGEVSTGRPSQPCVASALPSPRSLRHPVCAGQARALPLWRLPHQWEKRVPGTEVPVVGGVGRILPAGRRTTSCRWPGRQTPWVPQVLFTPPRLTDPAGET